MRLIHLAIFTICLRFNDAALFSWLFKNDKNTNTGSVESETEKPNVDSPVKDMNTDVLDVSVPFETRSSDEKFLMEAAEYTSLQLSELDQCHHKVILGLQTSCADLTEEDLSKVAVNLLNCQSVAEGRKSYPCTPHMTLPECTKNMDPNTWNAYHIVSNRARAVCYAARQDQFRAKTEMTVNKLMYSAQEQIRSMDDLQESQEALGKATSETFMSLSEGHVYLKKQQGQLSAAQHTIQNYVSSNLRELHKEKRIISAGQRELAHITEAIKRKLDEAKKQLTDQEESQRFMQSQILQDLLKIQDDAHKVWQKLDASTENILLRHEETIQQFSRLTQDLHDMNGTVYHLMDVLKSTKGVVEEKLSWISALVGGTDSTVQKVYSCVLHGGYFLVGMLAASFLQVPYLTRVMLVIVVPLNALSEIKNDSSLQFSTLTTLLAICIIVNLLFSLILGFRRKHKGQSSIRDEVRQYLKYEMQDISQKEVADISGYTKCMDDFDMSKKIFSITPPASPTPSSRVHDYSSDEEGFPTPVHKEISSTPVQKEKNSSIYLRKRVLESSICQNRENLLEMFDVIPPVESSFLEEGITSKLQLNTTDSEKTVSSVRRQLLDQLEPSQLSPHTSSFSIRSRRSTPSSSRSGTPSRSMTPKPLCAASCKNGQLCRNAAGSYSLYCHRHGANASLLQE